MKDLVPDVLVTDYVKHFASDEKHEQKGLTSVRFQKGIRCLPKKKNC